MILCIIINTIHIMDKRLASVFLLLVGCITLHWVTAEGQLLPPSVKLYPLTRSVYEGDTARFNCTGYRYDSIQWSYNDETFRRAFPDLEPTITFDPNDKNVSDSMIEIPVAILMHNDSKIVCRGISISQNIMQPSENGKLYVQGYPGMVLDFQGKNITDYTRLRFSWSPPYHVPGIPCCNTYYVNISSVDSGNIFSGNVSDTFIEVNVPSPHQCSVYEVQVSAFNGLGEGEVLITKWSPGGYFKTSEADVMTFYDKQELNVGVNVDIVGVCLNFLDNITLFVKCDSSPDILQLTNQITAMKDKRALQRYISLDIPSSHHDTYCTAEVALEGNIGLHGLPFNTHDVQDVNITVLPGAVCVLCKYLPNSTAKGCTLEVSPIGVDSSNIQVSINVAINDTRMGCLRELNQGLHRVRVYDWQDSGRSSQWVYNEVVNIPTDRKASPNSSVNVDPNTMKESKTVIIVGAVVPVVAVAIISVVVVFTIFLWYTKIKQQNNDRGGQKDETDSPEILLTPDSDRKGLSTNSSLCDILRTKDLTQWVYYTCRDGQIVFEKKK